MKLHEYEFIMLLDILAESLRIGDSQLVFTFNLKTRRDLYELLMATQNDLINIEEEQ